MERIKLLLFIDDDFATNFYHKIIVRDSGLVEKYLFFSSANEALVYFKEQAALGNPEKPDAIFLDINMPEITGWEFLDLYAESDNDKSPIYIMLTTSLNPEDQQRAELNPLVRGLKNKPLTATHLEELQKDLTLIV
ncbi:MAG: response regulator [Saprospiraceae bacterium]